MAEWFTIDEGGTGEATTRLVAAWEEAPVVNVEVCGMILGVAQEQVIEFAPVLADGEPIPDRYVLAQLRQAENLWNAGRAGSNGGEIGVDTFTFVPRPLDKTIRQIIRPVSSYSDVL